MDTFLLDAYHFIRQIWLPLVLVIPVLGMLWNIAGKKNAGLTMFQRFIRLCFGFARRTHGFACAVDGFFVAYRQGKARYAGLPVNEQLYPPAPPAPVYDEFLAHGNLAPLEQQQDVPAAAG